MMRSDCATGTWRGLAADAGAMKGGVLCRPTIRASVQQPGRERPRRPRARLFPALFRGRSRPGCPARRSQTVSAAIRTRMRSGIEPGIREPRRGRSALQPRHDADGFHSRFWSDFTTSFLVGTFRASVLFPIRVGGRVLLPRALKSEDENRRRHAEIAQRLEREVRSNIPTRVMRGFCTLEGLRMPAAKTGVLRHDSRRQRARFNGSRAVAPFSIIRERLARVE